MSTDGNNRRYRLSGTIRDRIRNRASGGVSSGSGGVSSESGGNGSGSGGNDSGTSERTAADAASDADRDIGNDNDVAPDTRQSSGNVGETSDDRKSSVRGNRTDAGSNRNRRNRNTENGGNDGTAQTVSKPLALLGKSVDISSILDDEKPPRNKRSYTPRRNSNNDILIPLQIVVDFLFGLPVYAGWGNHWELDAEENKDLCICVRDVLDAFPTKTSKAFIKALEKYIPLMSLGLTTWSIVKPRIQETRRLRAEKQNGGQVEQTEENRTQQLVM